MNRKRFILALIAVFIATFLTDFLIHGLWLEADYTRTMDLWRADPEIALNFPWTIGGQLLVAIVMVGLWAITFAASATVRRACLFGLMLGLLRQAATLTSFGVQPIPASLAMKWFVSGLAQSVLLALITFWIYKPKAQSDSAPRVGTELKWLIASSVIACVIVVALLCQPRGPGIWEQAIAYSTPPTSGAAPEAPLQTNVESLFFPMDTGVRGTPEAKAALLQDLARLDAEIRGRYRLFEPELQPLLDTLVKRQMKGKNVSYSLQIFREIRWWQSFTSDTNATRARIADLKKSLEDGRSQSFAEEQQRDGSWGPGYTVWFMKVYGSVQDGLSIEKKAKYPMTFLDRINSPEKLTNYMQSIVLDRFVTTGVLNRMEADEAASNLGRMILGDFDCNYTFHPQLKDAYLKFLDDWQNPETGCWGNWYVGRDGSVWRADDVGMTFHIVSLLEDKTKNLDKIARRVLELSTFDFPMGIRMDGRYENHVGSPGTELEFAL